MLGAIVGDIVGSVYEFDNIKTTEFSLFSPVGFCTDDSFLTIALAETILRDLDYAARMKDYYRRYPLGGYGSMFSSWARSADSKPYNSWGNGAAMRICLVGFAFDTLEEVLAKAQIYTEITHNHPEGIAGAQATAAAIFLARTGKSKDEIRAYVSNTFGTTSTGPAIRFAPTNTSTNLAKAQSLRRSLPFSSQPISRTRFV